MTGTRKARVTFVQPYLTAYRLPFYARLADELARRGIELTVAHGAPTGDWVARRDNVVLPGAVELPQRDWLLGSRRIVWRPLAGLARSCDALVLPQALNQLDAYPLLARRRRSTPVALWGHGRTHCVRHGAAARWTKAALTRRADWFFAYTDAGGEYAVRAGVPPQRVTVVRNALDTTALAAASNAVTEAELTAVRERYGLTPGLTGLYIGGLDRHKRIPYLLTAAKEIARRVAGFRLLVAGDGAERDLVAAAGGAVIHVGPAHGRDKALLGAAADIMLAPGAVGLCVVDSFALATPLVTCVWPFHGPEFDYVEDGRNALVVDGDTDRYAAAVAGLLLRPERLAQLRQACRADATRYTVEDMAARFVPGLEALVRGDA
ncbi:glycosyltransferase family 4 protein [Streptomyces sp. TG1A-60]|uniref:glycosyltransferase family 4 protein n=1 Tax=Streptomyces sp. TG1A-60 TaxID=3129111 RepID=UPI0030CA9D77